MVSSRALDNQKRLTARLGICGGQSFLSCLLSMYCMTFSVTSIEPWITVTINVSNARVSSNVIGHPPFAFGSGKIAFQKSSFPWSRSIPRNECADGLRKLDHLFAGSALLFFNSNYSISQALTKSNDLRKRREAFVEILQNSFLFHFLPL